MAVFRVERNRGYTVMSNHHLRNRDLTLKAKGLLSQMLSLPDNWDYILSHHCHAEHHADLQHLPCSGVLFAKDKGLCDCPSEQC